jgi:carbon starvation protein CstA
LNYYYLFLFLACFLNLTTSIVTRFALSNYSQYVYEANPNNFWIENDLWYYIFCFMWVMVFYVYYVADKHGKGKPLWEKYRVYPPLGLFLLFLFNAINDLSVLFTLLKL